MIQAIEGDIQALQPYTEGEYCAAMERLLKNPALPGLVHGYFPDQELSDFSKMANELRTVAEFQAKIISPAIEAMLKQCSDGASLSGLEHLTRERKYLFISNHRDIILDPALLTQRLCTRGYGTPKICLGDNLLTGPFIIDLIKMNKGVTVKRGLAPRELLRWSHALSELIFRHIDGNGDSVWIAQREGRTKDGNDQTHPGVLKMLAMAGHGTFLERLEALHVLPVAISYEYDPCDHFKARELYLLESRGSYQKAPGEDKKSMLEGIRGFKGRIHLALGTELSFRGELKSLAELPNKKDQVSGVAAAVDRQIRMLYRLWPSNYVAADLLGGLEQFRAHYDEEQRRHFVRRMEERLAGVAPELTSAVDRDGVRRQFLQGYARPVLNSLGV